MAASTTSSFPVPLAAAPGNALQSLTNRRRRITPQAGRAIEILGHAIEYLTDEFVHRGGTFTSANPELQAIQLLMALNRQVYFECPEVPPLGRRIFSMLHLN